MLILRGEIAKKRERGKISQLEADLSSILKEWSWQNQPFINAAEFLTKMKPWIDERIKQQGEVKEFLKKWKVKKLSEIKEVKK